MVYALMPCWNAWCIQTTSQHKHAAHYVGTKTKQTIDDSKKIILIKKKGIESEKVCKLVRDYKSTETS